MENKLKGAGQDYNQILKQYQITAGNHMQKLHMLNLQKMKIICTHKEFEIWQ